MNNPFMLEQAKRLAKRVAGEGMAASAERVQSIYGILYSRQPSAAELGLALGFLQLPAEVNSPAGSSIRTYCWPPTR